MSQSIKSDVLLLRVIRAAEILAHGKNKLVEQKQASTQRPKTQA